MNILRFGIAISLLLCMFVQSVKSYATESSLVDDNSNYHDFVKKAQRFIPANMDSARILLEKAQPLENVGSIIHKADYYSAWGLFFWFSDQPKESIKWFGKVLQLPEKEEILNMHAAAANNMGALYSRLGIYDSARIYLNHSLNIDIVAGNDQGIAKTRYDLSHLHFNLNQYELALQNILAAINLQEKVADPQRLARYYNTLGNIYTEIDSVEKARETYLEVISLAEESGLESLIPLAYNNLAATWNEKPGGIELSIQYAEKGLGTINPQQDIPTTIALYTNLGISYSNAGNREKALECYHKALELCAESPHPVKEAEVTSRLGHEHYLMGNYQESRKYFEQSDEIANRIHSWKYQSICHFGFAKLDSVSGDLKGYFDHYCEGINLRDSIWKNERLSRLDELQIMYESEKASLLISELELKEKANNRLLWIILIASVLLVSFLALVSLYWRKQHVIATQKRLLDEKERELLQVELSSKRQELANKILSLVKAEELLGNINSEVKKIIPENKRDQTSEMKTFLSHMKHYDNTKDLWKEFSDRFNELNDDFITKLVAKYPDLSPSEIRLCSMLRMQYSTKEIAELTNRSVRTIDFTRHSIRQKMNLPPETNLTTHILSI